MPANATAPNSSPVSPTHGSGVYLVVFADGTVGVVRWNGGPDGTGWEWGSLHPPGDVQAAFWLGPTFQDLSNLSGAFIKSLENKANLTIGQYRTLVHFFDSSQNTQQGTPNYGHPILIPSGIKPGQNAPGFKKSGDATPTNIVPNLSLPSLPNIFGVFATLDFWKGLGLVLAGAAIIVFAALEFKKMT